MLEQDDSLDRDPDDEDCTRRVVERHAQDGEDCNDGAPIIYKRDAVSPCLPVCLFDPERERERAPRLIRRGDMDQGANVGDEVPIQWNRAVSALGRACLYSWYKIAAVHAT